MELHEQTLLDAFAGTSLLDGTSNAHPTGARARMATDVDIAIVGGGAAGIAAAKRLAASGFSTIMLEASSRLGGRGWTQELAGFPLDLGCGWLHSADRNSWTGIAEQAGFAIDRREAAWGRQYANLGFSAEQQSAARRALNVWEQQLPRVVSRSDRPGMPCCRALNGIPMSMRSAVSRTVSRPIVCRRQTTLPMTRRAAIATGVCLPPMER